LDRRTFLKNSTLGLSSILMSSLISNSVQATSAATIANDKTLVTIYVPGGYDGLSFFPPYGDSYYYQNRPTISVPEDNILKVSNSNLFGFPQELSGFRDIYEAGDMSVFTAVDIDKPTRSHFNNQNLIFSQLNTETNNGWINEAFKANNDFFLNGLKVFSMDSTTPHIVRGVHPVSYANTVNVDKSIAVTRRNALQYFYDQLKPLGDLDNYIKTTYKSFVDDADLFSTFNANTYVPSNGATYEAKFGLDVKLKTAAYLLKNSKPNAIHLNYGFGFDTHQNQVSSMQTGLPSLAKNILAFYKDLGDKMKDVCILVFSEFGRTMLENGTAGTDHGNANTWFAISKNLHGGIYGDWLGLNPTNLRSGNFLQRTISAGDIFSEILISHLGITNLNNVFPNHIYKNIGFIKS
jgi:uncharacterized protein (DUF1501 family)